MNYEQKLDLIQQALQQNKIVAFPNMGDPCLYGMVRGMTDRLGKKREGWTKEQNEH